ncbi:hypothetical protein DSO57_1001531 [Entomophthora muscae]|uniref:Uncharacterized protein n=1 Tax=Entomophthora muscae TaxID=34485 RepID=A0ACC2RP09_9FUNG|nr:hypothetical protein DSO57_1001531 [Entomophthora muscae]
MKCLILTVVLSVASAYDASGASWHDFDCAGWLGNECACWMRCYNNGKYNQSNIKAGCEAAGLEFDGNKCWAKILRGKLLGGNQRCFNLAAKFCSNPSHEKLGYFKCLKG